MVFKHYFTTIKTMYRLILGKIMLKKTLSKELQCLSSETTIKSTRRSETQEFDWKRHCLFCGEICPVKPDPKQPAL